MDVYEQLLAHTSENSIAVVRMNLKGNLKGLYADKTIALNSSINSKSEETCILAEELGHYHTSSGDILDMTNIKNKKQELVARGWAYQKLVPFEKICNAFKNGVSSQSELVEILEVTDEFLVKALQYYNMKYGAYRQYKNFMIFFWPLGVMELY
jgi:hypothetical protein